GGEALAPVPHHPHAHPDRAGHGELLDLAAVAPRLGVGRARDVGRELLVVVGHGHDPVGDLERCGVGGGRPAAPGAGRRAGAGRAPHAAVPPTVSARTRRVGTPSPTGTPWPSLPQVPGLPMAKSLPTASMSRSTFGPLPMRLPSRSGSVMRPSSMR